MQLLKIKLKKLGHDKEQYDRDVQTSRKEIKCLPPFDCFCPIVVSCDELTGVMDYSI